MGVMRVNLGAFMTALEEDPFESANTDESIHDSNSNVAYVA